MKVEILELKKTSEHATANVRLIPESYQDRSVLTALGMPPGLLAAFATTEERPDFAIISLHRGIGANGGPFCTCKKRSLPQKVARKRRGKKK
jgi:hypothetical protein